MTLWKNLVVALVAAFVLAACSSSDNDTAGTPVEMPTDGITQDQLDAEREARERAEAEAKRLREEQEKMEMEAGAASAKAVFTALAAASTELPDGYDSDQLKEAMLERERPMAGVAYGHDARSSKRKSVGQLLRTKSYDSEMPVSPAPGNAGYFRIVGTELVKTAYVPLIASDAFKRSGDTTLMIEREGQSRTFPGTFDGASGTYICTGAVGTACTARKALEDGYTFVPTGANWEFQLSSNDVKTVEPDTQYLVWGWWTMTTAAGVVTFGSFVEPQGGMTAMTSIPDTLGGKATYDGKALGQYALYDPLPGQVKESGKFTADATLEATFGATDELSGMLSGFMTGSGEEKDWTVKLRKTEINASAVVTSVLAEDTPTHGTVWEIGDEAAEASSQWNAWFYDDTLDDVPGATPSDVAGTFSAMYERTGRMAGAFAAEHDTK